MTSKRNRLVGIKMVTNRFNNDGKPVIIFERQALRMVDGKGLARVCNEREYTANTHERANRFQQMIDAIIIGTASGNINAFVSTYHMTVRVEDDRLQANSAIIRETARQADDLLGTNSEWTFA